MPAVEIPEQVRRVWTELFAVDDIGMADDFFKLGGDSVMATLLMIQIEQTFGLQLDPIEVFEFPTLQDFAQAVERALQEEPAETVLL